MEVALLRHATRTVFFMVLTYFKQDKNVHDIAHQTWCLQITLPVHTETEIYCQVCEFIDQFSSK